MKNIFKSQREIENAHVFLWLLKDTSWSYSWRTLGMCMIVPTLSVQLWLTWKNRRDVHEVFHNLAVVCWISANAVWMTGEFFFADGLRVPARWFFGIGMLLVSYYYARHFFVREGRSVPERG